MAKDSHPNKCRPEAWQQLQPLVEQLDDNPNALLRACFAICRHDLVDADFAVVDAQIDQWTRHILETVHSREPRALMAHTHALLFDELGFCGGQVNQYDPVISYLPVVMETKHGLPVILSMIYCEVMRRLGITAHGIDCPSRFLAAVDLPEHPNLTYVDCYERGHVLTQQEAVDLIEQFTDAPMPLDVEALPICTPRKWIHRVLSNLVYIYVHLEREDDAEAMREMQRLVIPE